ncbi:MAG: TetR/AcrR family transcriptional regulator [Bacilli bacterium]|nr:TetR/AcrR family transcriptional regulator [Bacilli bacterium]
MARPLKREKGQTRSLLLHAATKLFLEKGYANTTMRELANISGVSYNEIFRMYDDKDTLLSHLIDLVIEHQFEFSTSYLKDKTKDNLLFYAFESTLQLYIAESSEHLREMYSVSYSLPHTSHKIYEYITVKLENVFKKYLPEYTTKDFYELEIATAGIMRGFLINPCNMYFTMDRKIKRFLKTTLKIYEVPKEEINQAITFVESFDMESISQEVINTLEEYIINRT